MPTDARAWSRFVSWGGVYQYQAEGGSTPGGLGGAGVEPSGIAGCPRSERAQWDDDDFIGHRKVLESRTAGRVVLVGDVYRSE